MSETMGSTQNSVNPSIFYPYLDAKLKVTVSLVKKLFFYSEIYPVRKGYVFREVI